MEFGILEIKRWIRENIYSVGSAKEVACHFGVSPECVGKLFLRHNCESISTYIRKRKLTEAADLLHDTDCRWYEIVDALHLGSPENATRWFRQEFGVGPKNFRKQRGVLK